MGSSSVSARSAVSDLARRQAVARITTRPPACISACTSSIVLPGRITDAVICTCSRWIKPRMSKVILEVTRSVRAEQLSMASASRPDAGAMCCSSVTQAPSV